MKEPKIFISTFTWKKSLKKYMRRWRNASSDFEENKCMSEKLYFMKIVKIMKTCSCDSLHTPVQKMFLL